MGFRTPFILIGGDDIDLWLVGYWIPILLGVFWTNPTFRELLGRAGKFGEWTLTHSMRTRLLVSLILILIGGFAVSAHTWWIDLKFAEGGGISCSPTSFFDCGDVISDPKWNSDPLFGVPWGLWGILGFTGMLYSALSVMLAPDEDWVELWLLGGLLASGGGLVISLWLVGIEIFALEKFCQYCSTGHVADLLATVLFWRAWSKVRNGDWE